MKILPILFIFLSVQQISSAQDVKAPDYEEIAKEVSDQNSVYYYPSLRARFDRRDSTLTFQDYTHFYYGFFFQSDFSLRSPEQDELDGYQRKNELTDQDCKRVIELASSVLKTYPFDLRRMAMLIYAYRRTKDEQSAKSESRCYKSIIDVIFYSGDGKTCETGYHVISISHEYSIMAVSKLDVTSQALVNHCDYLVAQDNQKHIPGLYFDITKVLEKEMAIFGGDKVGTKKLKAEKKRKRKGK